MLVIAKLNGHGEYQILSMGALSQKDAADWRKILAGRQGVKDTSGLIYFLFCQQNNASVAGDPVDSQKLRSNEDFQMLVAQMAFLDSKALSENRLQAVQAWMEKHDKKKMKAAAEWIYKQRTRKGDFADTGLARLFVDVRGC